MATKMYAGEFAVLNIYISYVCVCVIIRMSLCALHLWQLIIPAGRKCSTDFKRTAHTYTYTYLQIYVLKRVCVINRQNVRFQ